MEWLEIDPIPEVCVGCEEEDCYNCDTAGERWQLSEDDALKLRRKQLVRAIERMQREIDTIDIALLPFTDEQRAALVRRAEMTYDLFWECLQVCFDSGNMMLYRRIWSDYPNLTQIIEQKAKHWRE